MIIDNDYINNNKISDNLDIKYVKNDSLELDKIHQNKFENDEFLNNIYSLVNVNSTELLWDYLQKLFLLLENLNHIHLFT